MNSQRNVYGKSLKRAYVAIVRRRWLNGTFYMSTKGVRKSHCHVFLAGFNPGQAPLKTLLLMLRLT